MLLRLLLVLLSSLSIIQLNRIFDVVINQECQLVSSSSYNAALVAGYSTPVVDAQVAVPLVTISVVFT